MREEVNSLLKLNLSASLTLTDLVKVKRKNYLVFYMN